MSVEPGRREYPLAAQWRGWTGSVLDWWLRWRLVHVCAEIHVLERALDDEFGVTDTAPMYRELEDLCAVRDSLVKRRVSIGL